MSEWKRFFFFRLPLALIAIAMAAEGVALVLRNVTLHRHNVDDLAYSVEHDRVPYPVVLLGDSVTHNVVHRYRIGAPGEVADLTTHAFAGLPSSFFLLRRYLMSGHRPRQVVLAASRDVFVYPIEKSMFTYYVASVFTSPYERHFLQSHYASYVDYSWRPAALNLTTRIGEPLFSLIRRPGDQIATAPEVAPSIPVPDRFPGYHADEAVIARKAADVWNVRPEARAILDEICRLSREEGFVFHLYWAPMQAELHDALKRSGKLAALDAELATIFSENGTRVSIDDSVDAQRYPYFDRGLMHIRGSGWEETYALELGAFIARTDQAAAAQPSAIRQ